MSYFFFLCRSSSSSLCTVFDFLSSNIDEVLLINPAANVHHEDWLSYSGGTNRPGELCYNFSISNDLTQMVSFLARITELCSHNPALFAFILSSNASISSTMVLSPLRNSDHVNFEQIQIEMPRFIT